MPTKTLQDYAKADAHYQSAIVFALQKGFAPDAILSVIEQSRTLGISSEQFAKTFQEMSQGTGAQASVQGNSQTPLLQKNISSSLLPYRILFAVLLEIAIAGSVLIEILVRTRWEMTLRLDSLWQASIDFTAFDAQAISNASFGDRVVMILPVFLLSIGMWIPVNIMVNSVVKFIVELFAGYFAKNPYRRERGRKMRTVQKQVMSRVFSGASYRDYLVDNPYYDSDRERIQASYQPVMDSIDEIMKKPMTDEQEGTILLWILGLYLFGVSVITLLIVTV